MTILRHCSKQHLFQCSIVLYSTARNCIVLYGTQLHCFCIVLQCIALYCIILYCTPVHARPLTFHWQTTSSWRAMILVTDPASAQGHCQIGRETTLCAAGTPAPSLRLVPRPLLVPGPRDHPQRGRQLTATGPSRRRGPSKVQGLGRRSPPTDCSCRYRT